MNESDGELGGNEPGAPDTWNFSIDVAKGWEEAFFSTATADEEGGDAERHHVQPGSRGVIDVLPGLVRHGLGGRHRSGAQFVSRIHEADFARPVDLLIAREEIDGMVNLLHLRTRFAIAISCARYAMPGPPRRAGTALGRRLPVSVPRMARRRSRPGFALAHSPSGVSSA